MTVALNVDVIGNVPDNGVRPIVTIVTITPPAPEITIMTFHEAAAIADRARVAAARADRARADSSRADYAARVAARVSENAENTAHRARARAAAASVAASRASDAVADAAYTIARAEAARPRPEPLTPATE
jgi:hypothetical protein